MPTGPKYLAWLAMRAARRTYQLGRDSSRVLRGLVRTIRWAIAPSPPAAGLAVLEGEALARVGMPAFYRVRVHNPTATDQALHVLVTGLQEAVATPEFQLRWDVTLRAGESADRWIRSTWRSDGGFLDVPPGDTRPVWMVSEPWRRWVVEAMLIETPAAGGRLQIGGTLAR